MSAPANAPSAPPAATYLRVEGVNLSGFVFDTRDLSTNRGGSLMLLDAVGVAAEALGLKEDDLAILSRGASSGLFRTNEDAKGAATKVRDALSKAFPHATFVVDVIDSADFALAREQLLAGNRWRQMQAATVAVPEEKNASIWTQPACDLDGRRPSEEGKDGSHTLREKKLSESTWRRREYGRKQKSGFYKQETGISGLEYAGDFETICAKTGALSGKLAVFYADGNKFGAKQAEHCRDETKQRAFDAYLRGARRKFLKDLLESARSQAEWTIRDTDREGEEIVTLRFETLLWGGDEFMFVMPAALGWRFAALFFEKMEGLNLEKALTPEGTSAGMPDVPLTHAAALVYCQHHSPIHRIKDIAKDKMAEFAKEKDRSRDSLSVVALESFDHLGTDFEKAMAKRYAEKQPLEKMLLAPREGKALHKILTEFAGGIDQLHRLESFPRSQLRALVNEMLAEGNLALGAFQAETDENGHPRPPRHFRNADGEARAALAGLRPLFPDDATLWLQLEELWDYALP